MSFILPTIGIMTSLLVGLILIAHGLLRRPRSFREAAVGCVLVMLPTWFVWSQYNFYSTLDLNPNLKQGDVIGTWQYGSGILTINSDGNYECKNDNECKSIGGHGKWRYENFEIIFQTAENNKGERRRVVLQRGKMRLTDLPGDPDDWNEQLTFERNVNN